MNDSRQGRNIELSEMAQALDMTEKELYRKLKQDGYLRTGTNESRNIGIIIVEKRAGRGVPGILFKRNHIMVTPKGQEFLKTIYRANMKKEEK